MKPSVPNGKEIPIGANGTIAGTALGTTVASGSLGAEIAIGPRGLCRFATGSHASPIASWSPSSWLAFATDEQLSLVFGTPSRSTSLANDVLAIVTCGVFAT